MRFANAARRLPPAATALALLLLPAVALAPVGCGGGTDSPAAATPRGAGRAVFSVRWPERDGSRLVPVASESIRIMLRRGEATLAERVLPRPAQGGVSEAAFADLPLGDLVATATAFPNADGSGVAQASAALPVTVAAGENTPLRLTMASTIDRIEILPASLSLNRGQSQTLTAVARSAAGEVVIVSAFTLVWQSGNTPVASVSGAGQVTGIAAGEASIGVRDTESGKSATASVRVTGGGPPGGGATFQPPTSYPVPGAGDVVVGDLNGDDRLDVVCGGGRTLWALYGRGDGTFGTPQSLQTFADAIAPQAVVDMNNDGRRDIVCRDGLDKVRILRNEGGRTYYEYFATAGFQPSWLAVADFDGDDFLDVAASIPGNGPGGHCAILLNNGDGTLRRLNQTYGIPGIALGLAAGDLDRDGRVDLVASFTTSTVNRSGFLILKGNGNGGFNGGNRYDTGTLNVVMPSIADFNLDGTPDVAVDNYFDHNISVLLGSGGAQFQTPTYYSAAPYPHYHRAADLNQDGWPDIVAANAGSGNFSVLRNRGNGLFYDREQYVSGGQNTRTVDVGDFNRDNRIDLVFGNESSGTVTIVLNSTP